MATKKSESAANDKLAADFLNQKPAAKPPTKSPPPKKTPVDKAADRGAIREDGYKCGGKAKAKKFAKGGGIEIRGKTRGKII
jgi:hypothetical protein